MQIGAQTLPDRVPDPTTTDPGAQTSGPGFDRLIAAAQAEADRRKAIADKTGASADQFTEQSWFAIVKAHGAEVGLGPLAGKITKDAHGQLTVVDPVLRARVMNYRSDPLVRSVMAVKRAADVKAVMNADLGRPASDAEMRAADVVGGKIAAKLILTRQSTPNASAALVAPDAAKANRMLFYRPDGSPHTVDEVVTQLTKIAEGPGEAERLAASQAAFPGMMKSPAAAAPTTTSLPTQGLTPEMAATARARAAFANASSPQQQFASHQRTVRQAPPDLALVNGTIANLSMPGKATGVTAPTGGKLTGWRSQVAGEVTHQLEHPESTVTNLPSNVTIPAPDPRRRPPIDQYAQFNPTVVASTAPVQTQAQPIVTHVAASSLLGPQLAPSSSMAQPIPPVAFAQPMANVPQAPTRAEAPLPALVTGQPTVPVLPASALPLLPIDDNGGPLVLSPSGTAPSPTMATSAPQAVQPAPVAEPAAAQAPEVAARPSRYGPQAGVYGRMVRAQVAPAEAAPTQVLNYAPASPLLQTQAISDAASAGIRPSRYYASTVQQMASLGPAQPQMSPIQQPAALGMPITPLPVEAAPVIGPDGNPILPPVPPRAGLPPITADQALQPGSATPGPQATQTALFSGTKPLDLAPVQQSAPAPIVATQPLQRRQRPHLTPPQRF